MANQGPKSYLSRKVAIYTILVGGLLAMIFTGIQVYIEYKRDVNRIHTRFALIETSYLSALASSLWRLDVEQSDLIARGIQSLPDVVFVQVEGLDWERSFAYGNRPADENLMQRMPLIYDYNGTRVRVGSLTVGVSLDFAVDRTIGLVANILVSNFLKSLLMAAYIIFLIRHLITRHLLRISEYFKSGSPKQTLHLERPSGVRDELEIVVESIRGMQIEIDEKIATIEDHKAHLAEEVARKTQALKQAFEQKTGLLRVLCHDLSNPLILLKGISETLCHRDLGPEDLERNYKVLLRAANMMIDILVNVREMEAIGSGKRNIKIVPVELRTVFDNILFLFKDRLEEKGITLEVHNDVPESVKVMADPVSLSNQVLSNLISNAIKFSFRNSTIEVRAKLDDDQVCIEVRDYGVGMAREYVETIFDPNRQTTRPGTQGEKGTGFGMPLVKAFVDRYGGTIEVKSISAEEDPSSHGTSFHITLNKAA